jgi:uridine kinase
MLGDVLLIADKHRSAATEIISKILETRKDRIIVCISGESGSGKSELSHCIGKDLVKIHKIPTKIIHSDNYYRIHPHIRNKWRQENGIENVGLGELDWETLNRNVDEFLNASVSRMPCIDLVPDDTDELITDFSKVKILIVDGLYSIAIEKADLRIYINLTYHETKKAQADRGKENTDDLRWRILEQEHKTVISLRDKTDIFVNKDYSVTCVNK